MQIVRYLFPPQWSAWKFPWFVVDKRTFKCLVHISMSQLQMQITLPTSSSKSFDTFCYGADSLLCQRIGHGQRTRLVTIPNFCQIWLTSHVWQFISYSPQNLFLQWYFWLKLIQKVLINTFSWILKQNVEYLMYKAVNLFSNVHSKH